jgi:hypothetical protein
MFQPRETNIGIRSLPPPIGVAVNQNSALVRPLQFSDYMLRPHTFDVKPPLQSVIDRNSSGPIIRKLSRLTPTGP